MLKVEAIIKATVIVSDTEALSRHASIQIIYSGFDLFYYNSGRLWFPCDGILSSNFIEILTCFFVNEKKARFMGQQPSHFMIFFLCNFFELMVNYDKLDHYKKNPTSGK